MSKEWRTHQLEKRRQLWENTGTLWHNEPASDGTSVTTRLLWWALRNQGSGLSFWSVCQFCLSYQQRCFPPQQTTAQKDTLILMATINTAASSEWQSFWVILNACHFIRVKGKALFSCGAEYVVTRNLNPWPWGLKDKYSVHCTTDPALLIQDLGSTSQTEPKINISIAFIYSSVYTSGLHFPCVQKAHCWFWAICAGYSQCTVLAVHMIEIQHTVLFFCCCFF